MIRAYYVSLHGANEKKVMAESPARARHAYARIRKLSIHVSFKHLKVRMPKLQACKDGKQRKGKGTISAQRLMFRNLFWIPLRDQLREWYKIKGNGIEIARIVGISPSQVHRYTCPVCEHDQEPPFSTAMAIMVALTKLKANADAIITFNQAKRVHV